jgi:hypothetical protein
MQKTFSQSDYSSLIKYARNFSNIELERRTYIPSITSNFHQNPIIPSEDIMLKTFSQSDCSSLIIKLERGICVPSIISKFHQNDKIPPYLFKISSGKHSANQIIATLIEYSRNLSNIKLGGATYVLSITSKFHQNPTIPS